MWDTLTALSPRPGGVFLEPGCGRGSFLSEAPAGWDGLGVELDPATARVARVLADPRHTVLTGDFAATRLVPQSAAAFIGNVPFGSIRLYDPDGNPGRRLPIHDHFIAKATRALAPGGVGVVLTSRYTLDKLDDSARSAIGEHADFLGALRLPSTAHQAEAGTDVVTDLIVLRARGSGALPRHAPGWESPPVTITEWGGLPLAEPVRISAYYAANPGQVLGRVAVDRAMFGMDLVVQPTGDLASQLGPGLARVIAAAPALDCGMATPAPGARPEDLLAAELAHPPAPVGRIERDASGFRMSGLAGWERYDPPANQRLELARLVSLRDQAERLVASEADPASRDEDLTVLRTRLAQSHASYVREYGPVNRVKVNEETGRRTYPRLGGFRADPGFARVASLEVFDEALGTAEPAAILKGRVVRVTTPPERADTPADALALSLQQRGRVDLTYIAALLDTSPAEATTFLADRVFHEPGRDWVTAEEYLSGNVRDKLAKAETAAKDRPNLARNVRALRAVQPVDVVATDLEGTLGAPWVEERYVTEFARSLSSSPPEVRGTITALHAESNGQWEVNASSRARARMTVGHPFGGETFDALRILQDRLNGRPTIITHQNADGKAVVDPEATAAAGEKAEAISDAFDKWLLVEDPERSAAVLAAYNERFNAHVARSYSGVRVDPPGLRDGFDLRSHQHQAIARMVHGGNTLLAHPVGAGKTAEMIVGAMELRRLGTINLPAFVVPNHMLEQFSRDIVDLYPSASVLTIDKHDVNPSARALFAARVQSNDWDAVVITHSSFARWPVSPEVETADVELRMAATRADLTRLAAAKSDRTLTKTLEKKLASQQERLKALTAEATARRDTHSFYFDQSGIDYLCVDEAHEFKNAELRSSARNLRGVPVTDGSQRSQDLTLKLRSLQERRPGLPVVTFATGTPVSNTAAEIWVMARYLRPDLCAELGVTNFDDFRAQFCDTTSAMELDPSGTRLSRVERLARYKNLPELARMIGEFADVVQIEDLDLPRPVLVGGERRIVVLEPDPGLAEFMAVTVSKRADAIKKGMVDRHDDNMLKLTSDCKAASFDWASFSGQPVADRHCVLAVAANQIAEVYHAHRHDTFVTETGQPHPRPGALQVVFSDLGTPKPGVHDTAYDQLRSLLVDRGVPAAQIGFIHEHDGSDEAKARFFEMCRDGRIAVAVSSTAKMGIGTNVQNRLVALHHLDVPWRPSDVEQREGRILRQGNQHAEVEIFAYATERSFSTFGWQTIERKAGFIGQLMRADPAGPRTLDPADDETLSYGQIKALATGDPGFLEVAQLEDTIARLSRLERAHSQEIAALGRRENHLNQQHAGVTSTLEAISPLADRVAGLPPERPWRIEIAGRTYDNRGDAARALNPLLGPYSHSRILGFPDERIEYAWWPAGDGSSRGRLALVTPDSRATSSFVVEIDDRSEAGLMGALTRATNQVRSLPTKVREMGQRLEELDTQLVQVRSADRSVEFARRGELVKARHRLTELSAELAERYAPPDPPAPGAAAPAVTGPAPAQAPGAAAAASVAEPAPPVVEDSGATRMADRIGRSFPKGVFSPLSVERHGQADRAHPEAPINESEPIERDLEA